MRSKASYLGSVLWDLRWFESTWMKKFSQGISAGANPASRGSWGATVDSESWLQMPAITVGEPEVLIYVTHILAPPLCLKTYEDVRSAMALHGLSR